MTACHPTRSDVVLVGIDIAKYRHEVLIEAPGHARRRRLTILNAKDDFDRLAETLRGYGRHVRAGFEATGNYHRALAYALTVAGFETKLRLIGRPRADPRGIAQRLGQERPEGRAGDPAHAPDRRRAILP